MHLHVGSHLPVIEWHPWKGAWATDLHAPISTSAARSVSQPFPVSLGQQAHGGISSSSPGAGIAGAQADHPLGVAPLKCQDPGQGSWENEEDVAIW